MNLHYPKDKLRLAEIHVGDVIQFTGTIYTARDAAHIRLKEMLGRGEKLPVDFRDSFIY